MKLLVIAAVAGCAMAQSADRAVIAPQAPPPQAGLAGKVLDWIGPDKPKPLTAEQRWQDYLTQAYGPGAILSEAASAGSGQLFDSPPEWGQGMSGYGKRLANDLAYNAVRNTLQHGTAALLHEDNRYFGSGKQNFWARVAFALESPVAAQHRDGHRGFSYSGATGIVGVSLISRAWSPPSWRGADDVAVSAALTYAGTAGVNLVKEFIPDVIRKIKSKN